MFDINMLQNIVVEFKMPFALDVRDCIEKDDTGEPYLVWINDIPAQIRTKRIFNENPTIPNIQLANPARIENDRYGLISNMFIQVWFDNRTFNNVDKEIILNREIHFFHLALTYLNKFILEYKRVTREYWINQVGPSNFIGFTYYLLDKNKEHSVTLLPVIQSVHFNGGMEYCLSSDKEEAIRYYISVDENNFFDDLALSISDNYDKGFYNIALIQCAIRFENSVYSILKDKLSKTKLNKIKKKECGCLVGISEVCSRGLNERFGIDFGETNEFKEFHTNVLKLRNELVHGERLELIGKAECANAMNSTANALNYLWEEFKKIPGER